MRARVLLTLLISLSIASWCGGQTRQWEVSAHFTGSNSSIFDISPGHFLGFGAQGSYDLSHRWGIDSGFTFYPADTQQLLLHYGKAIEFQAGPRFAVVRSRRIGIFARVRPGVIRFSDLRLEFPADPLLPGVPAQTVRQGPQSNFALDYGGTVEWYMGRRAFVRADFGDDFVRYGAFQMTEVIPGPPVIVFTAEFPEHWKHQYKVSLGAGWRFGRTDVDRFGNSAVAPDRKWTVGAQYSTLYIDGWRNGAGVQASRRIKGIVEWGAVANVFPGYKPEFPYLWLGNRIVQLQTGPAVQLVGGRIVSLKAHVRPGFFNYDNYQRLAATSPESRTEFNINYGIGAEFNVWKRVPLRVEVSDNLIHHGGGTEFSLSPAWDHAPQVSFGIGIRF